MGLLKGSAKVVFFKESIYFGLGLTEEGILVQEELEKMRRLLELAIRYKTLAESLQKERGKQHILWKRKKEKQEKEMLEIKMRFYDDRDLRDLVSFETNHSETHSKSDLGDTLRLLAKEKKERDSVFPPPLLNTNKNEPEPVPDKSTKKYKFYDRVPNLKDF